MVDVPLRSIRVLYATITNDISGAELSLLSLVVGVDRQWFTPVVLCPAHGPFTDRLAQHGVVTEVLVERPSRLPRGRLVRQLAAWWFWVAYTFAVFRAVRVHDIRLIHANSYRVGIPCSVVARLLRRPCVWHLRDIPLSRVKRLLLGVALHLFPSISIAISHAVADACSTLGSRRKVTVVYNGIDIVALRSSSTTDSRSALGIPHNALLLGNVGQFIPVKGQEHLIRALPRVLEKFPDVSLLLCGYRLRSFAKVPDAWRDYEVRLRQQVADAGLRDHVVFVGFQSNIGALMNSFDIYVHTAVWPEPFGRVIVEAMAVGTPVVAPRIGGIPELIPTPEHGVLYPAGNADMLADTLIELLADQPRRARLADKGRVWAEQRFPAQKHIQAVQEIYSTLLQRGTAPRRTVM